MTSIPQHIKDLFASLDTDNSGALDRDELGKVLEQLGIVDPNTKEEKLGAMMAAFDPHGTGEVSLQQFWDGAGVLGLAQQQQQRDVTMSRGLAAFQEIDHDDDGELDRAELLRVVRKMGVPEGQLKEVTDLLMDAMDHDGDGTVSLDEFTEAIKRGVVDSLVQGVEELHKKEHGSTRFKDRRASRHARLQRIETTDDDDGHESFMSLHRGLKPPTSQHTTPDKTEATQHLSDSKYQYLWDLFCVADDDHSGEISGDELFDLMNDPSLFKGSMSRDVVSQVMASIDTDNNGSLDFEEFCIAFDQLFKESGAQVKGGIMDARSRALAAENDRLHDELEEKEKLLEELMQVKEANVHHKHLEQEIEQLHQDNEEKDQSLLTLSRRSSTLEVQVQELEDKLQKANEARESDKLASISEGFEGDGEAVQLLRQELLDQSTVFGEDLERHVMQVAVAEIQLNNIGMGVHTLPDLDEHRSFYSRLPNEKQKEVEEFVEARTGKGGRAATQQDIEVSVKNLDEAKEYILILERKKLELEALIASQSAASRSSKADLEKENFELSQRAGNAESLLQQFQDRTKEVFLQQQEQHAAEMDKLKDELAAAKLDNDGKRYAADSMQSRMRQTRLRLKTQSELVELVEEKTRALEAVEAELNAVREQYEASLTQTEHATAAMEAQHIAELTELENHHAAAIDRLKTEMQRSGQQHGGSVVVVSDGSKADSEKALETARNHAKQLETQLSAKDAELQGINAVHAKEIEQLQDAAKESQEELQRKMQRLIENCHCDELRSELNTTKNALAAATSQMGDSTTHTTRLTEQLEEARRERDVFEAKSDALETSSVDLKRQIEEKDSEIEDLKQKLDEKTKELEALIASANNRDALDKMEAVHNANLEEVAAAHNKELSSLRDEVDALQKAKAALEATHREDIEKMKEVHASEIQAQSDTESQSRQQAVDALNAAHMAELAKVAQQHDAELDALRATHASALDETTNKHTSVVSDMEKALGDLAAQHQRELAAERARSLALATAATNNATNKIANENTSTNTNSNESADADLSSARSRVPGDGLNKSRLLVLSRMSKIQEERNTFRNKCREAEHELLLARAESARLRGELARYRKHEKGSGIVDLDIEEFAQKVESFNNEADGLIEDWRMTTLGDILASSLPRDWRRTTLRDVLTARSQARTDTTTAVTNN